MKITLAGILLLSSIASAAEDSATPRRPAQDSKRNRVLSGSGSAVVDRIYDEDFGNVCYLVSNSNVTTGGKNIFCVPLERTPNR